MDEAIQEVVESGVTEEAAKTPLGWIIAGGIALAATISAGVVALVRHLKKTDEQPTYTEASAPNDDK